MPDPSLNPPSAATGLRVVELGDPKVGYAAKLFGDMGADVIKIEPLGGEASRRIGPFVDDIPDANKSLFFWHYNTSKRGVTLELDKAEGRALFRRLVDSADILLDGEKPGRLAALELGYETLEAANPKLIACSVTPFGQDGPWRDLLASDLIHMALGGQMASTGPDDPTGQPIAGTGYQSLHVGGNFAAIAILTALVERDASGRGQYIDISIHDACATCTEIAIPSWIYTKQGVYRQIGRHAMVARDSRQNFRAADGKWVNTILPMISTPQWHALVQWMGQHMDVSELKDEKFIDAFYRRANWAKVAAAFEQFIAMFPSDWIYHQAQQRHLSWGQIRAPEENLADPGLIGRGFWHEVEHPEIGRTIRYPGAPIDSPEMRWRISRRAPLLGEHNFEVYGKELGLTVAELTALAETGAI